MTRWTNTLLVALLMLLGGLALPATARAESGCTTALLDCYNEAAKIADFWYRTAKGIDCEIDYLGCVRDRLLEE